MKLFLSLFLLAGLEVTSYAMPHLATECQMNLTSGESLPGHVYFDLVTRQVNLGADVWGNHGGIRQFTFARKPNGAYERYAIGFHFGNRYVIQVPATVSLPHGLGNGTVLNIGDAFGFGETGPEPMIGKYVEVELHNCLTH